jgi:hypothetical protein
LFQQSDSKEQTKAAQEHPVRQDNDAFDTRVHIRDRQTGRLIRLQHYALHINGTSKMYEQPVGSGNMFDPVGRAIGKFKQILDGHKVRWEKISDEHEEVTQRFFANREELLEDENTQLKNELAALKAEQEEKFLLSAEPKNDAKADSIDEEEPKVTIGESSASPKHDKSYRKG